MQLWPLLFYVQNSSDGFSNNTSGGPLKPHKIPILAPMILRTGLLIVFISGLVSGASAQSGGNNTYEFLNLVMPSRVVALGGNIISLKDNDFNLSFRNPALLDSSHHNHLALNYINHVSDIQHGYAAYARSYKSIGNFSAGIQYADFGTFTRAEVTGETTGVFSVSEYALNLSWSRPLNANFSAGGTLKTIYSRASEYTSFGNALDLGLHFQKPGKLFSAGLVVKNIGKQWKVYNVVHEPLPFEIQAGISRKVTHAPFRISLTAVHLEKWNLTYTDPAQIQVDPISGDTIVKKNFNKFTDKLARHFVVGVEMLLSKNFHIRLGYNYLMRQEMKVLTRPGITGFSFGFGLKVSKFYLSYGYARQHLAGGPNHFTITSNLSDFYSRKK